MLHKIFSWSAAGAVVCLLLLAAGCAQTTSLALKFIPQETTTYKVTTQAERSIKFEGSLTKAPEYKTGRNYSEIEMTFTQQIQSINDKDNAVAKITIEGLKYLSLIKDDTVLDFDSAREKDAKNPLAKLIGQSYTVEITPAGKVTKVGSVSQARTAVRGTSSAHKAALKLLSQDAIEKRHGTLTLPVTDKNQLQTGDNWSGIKIFSFGLMGLKSYEKIYTLKEIKDTDAQRIAVVEMNAIPTSKMAEQLHKEESASTILNMFDNTETYTGRLTLDLTAGKVEKYLEKLRSEWIIVDPSAEQRADKEPDALIMTATRLYRLEKID